MIQTYFKSHGLESPGLNKNDLGGASVGQYQIYFEYQPSKQALKCSALIYKFHTDPKPGVIEGFADSGVDTGGGKVEYEPENKGLFLSHSYCERVPDDEFAQDLMRLMQASEVYGDQVLERVSDLRSQI